MTELTASRPSSEVDVLHAPDVARPITAALAPNPADNNSRSARMETEPAAPTAMVRVELEPGLTGGYIKGRYELWLRGRVVSPSRIEQVALRVNDQVAGRILYSRAAGGRPASLADGAPAFHCGFAFCLPRPDTDAGASCAFAIEAQTEATVTHAEPFLFEPNAGPGGAPAIVMGPTGPHAGALPPITLYIESASLDRRGHLLVQGWALSQTTLLTIQAFAEEERIGVAQLGQARQDVAQVHPHYPNAATSGFVIQTRLDSNAADITHVRVEAINLQGCTHEVLHPVLRVDALAPQQSADSPRTDVAPPPDAVPDKRRAIHMHCDAATLVENGHLSVSGWALAMVGIAGIDVEFDSEHVGRAELALPRPDVVGEYSSVPMAGFSGFRFSTLLPRQVAGDHKVTLVVRNGLDDLHTETIAVTTVAATETTGPSPAEHAAAPGERMAFRLEVDMPAVVDDAVKQPVTGMLTLQGWALAQAGVASIEVFIDGEGKGQAHYGLSRPDVAGAFPGRDDALRSGYVFLCPLRGLANGEHKVKLAAIAADGQTKFREFTVNVQKDDRANGYARIRRSLPPRHVDLYLGVLRAQPQSPHFRLVIRVDKTADLPEVETTIRTLRTQVYNDWSVLLLARTSAVARAVGKWIDRRLSNCADRITCNLTSAAKDFGAPPKASGRSSDAVETMYGFLTPGDELGCDALIEILLFCRHHPEADLVYADEARASPVTGEREAFFKPDWSPDLLLSTNYIGRPWFVTAAVLVRGNVTPRTAVTEGDYSLVLRCTENAAGIRHHARLLCERGRAVLDTPEAEIRALKRALERRRMQAEIMPGCGQGIWRLRRQVREPGLVSIIIPTCAAKGYIKTCIETLRAKTANRRYEIICVDNILKSQQSWKAWLRESSDKIVDIPEVFNWSRFNNLAALHASGEYLLFLNDDIEIIQDDWLDVMLEHAQRREVGVVGPQLLYPDRKVQHAGMFLSAPGTARHAFRMLQHDDPGYFGLALTQRNVIAVTGACMLVKRTDFDALGGFDEAHTVVNNDVDYCLRAHKAGQLTVFTPHATLIHHELASRDRMTDIFDTTRFNNHWKGLFAAGDPYFNPRLSLHWDDYRPDDEPAQEIFVGHPLARAEDIKRILISKLDHIGDFITAIPAIRRLKAEFPHASLHVLASRGARPFAEMESAIDEFHEFEFFHVRSGLGQRELTAEDYEALHHRLLPNDYDLAIDLRMHPDTRVVLGHIPARFRAGYDHLGEFPFLDIVLEWNKDSPLQRKRTHVSDALLNLVAAVATAFSPVDEDHVPRASPLPDIISRLPPEAQPLFHKSVVALHPGVGNTARQWPAEHFAALADLLVEKGGVNVILIGTSDEQALAETVLEEVTHRDAVVSLAGKTTLRDLPALLQSCILYVGNNSGPKHIAASLGLPTIGIHSGVVDAIEWGPLGDRAFALQRNMLCKPCYLLKADDCPRSMACLRQLEPALVYQHCELLLGTVAR